MCCIEFDSMNCCKFLYKRKFISLQVPPDFYVSKYQQESKPISDNEFYRDDKDNDK